MDLDEILKKLWQNGYQINQWDDLKSELRVYYGEQIAKEIEAMCEKETWTIYTDIGNFVVTGCTQETGEDGTILGCSHDEDAQIVGGQK